MEYLVQARPEPLKVPGIRTGLIVVDMQNAFCSRGGLFDRMGRLSEDRLKPVIESNRKLIDALKMAGIKIIYLRMGYRLDLADAGGLDSPNYWKEGSLKNMHQNPAMKDQCLVVGSWDWQIIDELQPQPGDIVVDKNRFSGFANTNLNVILQTFNLKYLLFSGVFTNICVESTLRDAFFQEYFPVLVTDCCLNTGPDFTQQATVWNVTSVFGWATTLAELIDAVR